MEGEEVALPRVAVQRVKQLLERALRKKQNNRTTRCGQGLERRRKKKSKEKYVGLDNQVYTGTIPNDKVTVYAGPEYNAYSLSMLDLLREKEGLFDVIIDDGPHSWASQDWFFRNYYSLLNDGGVLVCEDINGYDVNNLAYVKRELGLYVLDLRVNNSNKDEIIGLRYK